MASLKKHNQNFNNVFCRLPFLTHYETSDLRSLTLARDVLFILELLGQSEFCSFSKYLFLFIIGTIIIKFMKNENNFNCETWGTRCSSLKCYCHHELFLMQINITYFNIFLFFTTKNFILSIYQRGTRDDCLAVSPTVVALFIQHFHVKYYKNIFNSK